MAKAGKKFNLTELLNQRSKEVAEPMQQGQQSEAVTPQEGVSGTADIYDLIPSKGNFYSVEDVQDLKQSIELLGVLQPLLVTEEEDPGDSEKGTLEKENAEVPGAQSAVASVADDAVPAGSTAKDLQE